MTHIMLDLETWGKVPGSDIRSIGACVFDPVRGTVWAKTGTPLIGGNTSRAPFYIATDNPALPEDTESDNLTYYWDEIDNYRKYPLTRDPETVQWWNDQTPEAQAAFANPVDLKKALIQFSLWFGQNQNVSYEKIRIWANDPHFDVSILDAVFRAVQLPTPWHYRSPRSVRTVVELAGMTSANYSNYGTAHNALDDAIAQAMTVCEAYKRLGLQR